MDELTREIAQAVGATLARFQDPSQRIYWPFLIASAALALAFCVYKREKLRQVLGLRIWTHPSARMDYRLVFVNALVRSLLWGSLVAATVSVVAATHSSMSWLFGDLAAPGWATWQITALYTLLLFVAHDVSRYLLHRLMHEVSFLWHFHQVHHSAEVLTPMTVYRVHPLESFLYGVRGALSTGLVTGLFWYLFHGRASAAELLGVNAIGIVLNAAGANLRHSHVWLSFGRLEEIIISPAQHQMHHDRNPEQVAVNYGSMLSLWDRLGGSWRRALDSRRPEAFGLPAEELNHQSDSVLSAYLGPVAGSCEELVRATVPMVKKPATAFLALSTVQCGNGGSAVDEPDAFNDGFDRAALVRDLESEVMVPTLESAVAESEALSAAIDTYCLAIEGATEAAALEDARSAWREAMLAWQRAELMIIGPASPDSLALRENIYSWPVVSACAVDQGVMAAHQTPDFDIGTQLLNRRGIDALEYLLFNEVEESVCAPQIAPVGWDALSSLEKRQARCSFAQHAITDLIGNQSALHAAWTDSGGFLDELAMAGTSSSSIASPRDAANLIFGGLFYLELQTKDVKLGAAVGATENSCNAPGAPCPASLESQYARLSKEEVRANLEAFDSYFEGGGGLGFVDFMIARGGQAKAEELRLAIDETEAALDAVDGTLRDALDNDFADAEAAYSAMQGVTSILKNDMPGLLELDLPTAAGGDAD